MNVYIPLGLLLALFCFALRNNVRNRRMIFILLFLPILVFSAIRFGFGPDYFSYWDIWQSVRGADVEGYTGVGSSVEPLFLKFLQLFPKYTWFIVFGSVFLILSYYTLFEKYVPIEYLWLAVLFLFFNCNCLLGNYVAMRTMLCSILFVAAFFFLNKNNLKGRIIYILIILLASQIHTSAIVLLVFVLLNTKQTSVLYQWYFIIPIGVVAVLSVLIGNNIIVSYISSFLVDNVESFDRYQEYEIGNVSSSLMAILFRIFSFVILAYIVISAKKETEQTYTLIYKIAIVAAIIQLFFGQSIISDRYLMILNPFYIIAITRAFISEKQRSYKVALTVLVLGISLYLFNAKINKDYSSSFLIYQTVFSQNIIP